MSRIGRAFVTPRTRVSSTPYNVSAGEVSLDVLVGATVNLPKASNSPGAVIEVFNPSASTITIALQDAGDTIEADGASGSSATIVAGASNLYISDGVTAWHEF